MTHVVVRIYNQISRSTRADMPRNECSDLNHIVYASGQKTAQIKVLGWGGVNYYRTLKNFQLRSGCYVCTSFTIPSTFLMFLTTSKYNLYITLLTFRTTSKYVLDATLLRLVKPCKYFLDAAFFGL